MIFGLAGCEAWAGLQLGCQIVQFSALCASDGGRQRIKLFLDYLCNDIRGFVESRLFHRTNRLISLFCRDNRGTEF